MKNETVVVLDFGGQYNQLIARRVRECNVYCEVLPYTAEIGKIKALQPKGIIFTGGPNSVYEENAPMYSKEIFELGVPVLGICYGNQLMAHVLGGKVSGAEKREYGKTEITLGDSLLFDEIEKENICWMSHTDFVAALPEGFCGTAKTAATPYAAYENREKKLYSVQFHPEVNHTPFGKQMLRNFLYKVCGCNGDWKMADYAKTTIAALKEKIGDKKVLCALSGGADS